MKKKLSLIAHSAIPLRDEADNKNMHVIHEAIVGAFGLPPGKLFVSIKGDPTLRETAVLRPRQESRIDHEAGNVLDTCEWLLRKTGCSGIYIGFNSSEVRTESVFNPCLSGCHTHPLPVVC